MSHKRSPHYSVKFRNDVIQLVRNSTKSRAEIAQFLEVNPSTLNNWMARAKPKKDSLKSGAEDHKNSLSETARKYTQEILSTLSKKPGEESTPKESHSKGHIDIEQDLFSDEAIARLRDQKRYNYLENTERGIPKRADREEKASQKHETIEQLRKENARLARQRDTYREVVILLAMQGEE